MPPGRPTDYKPEYCDMMIEMLRTGLGFSSFADSIDVHVDTLHEWAKVHEEFSEAKKRAKCGKAAAWEKKMLLPKEDPRRPSDATCIFMIVNAAPNEYSNTQKVVDNSPKDDASTILNSCSPETLSAIARDIQSKK